MTGAIAVMHAAAVAAAPVHAIALRPATAADCERVYAWRFAPEVRAVSGDPAIVPWCAHVSWFAARLAMTDAPMWIVEADGEAVGTVRIDADARISIVLGAAVRGRGLGRRAIAAACARWARPVTADIRTDNTASRACFEACGFVLASADQRHAALVTYQWRP